MEIYAITPVFALILLIAAAGGSRGLLILVAAMVPFGMLAVIGLPAVGGLSLLAVNMAAAALVGGRGLVLVSRIVARRPIHLDGASIALICFALYAVFSATVLVRLFAGEIMVFPLARDVAGTRVSTFFAWGKTWLGPSNANISQTFYVLLACAFFLAARDALRQWGPDFGARCMALAAGVNIALGLMDLMAMDALLDLVRTANYSLINAATVQGIPRVIGGYSEAAGFGAASALFFAFFAPGWLETGRGRDGLLALGNGAFALLALSSTGVIAMAVICALLLPRLIAPLRGGLGRGQMLGLALMLALGGLALAGLLILTPAPEMIASVIGDLIVNKSQSASGMERTAWAMGGLETLRDTWGLGAGTGSLRSNGLAFVLLGSMGVIGTGAFLAFLVLAFTGRPAPAHRVVMAQARLGAVAVLVTMLLAATIPDPGIPLVFLAAIALAARDPRPAPRTLPFPTAQRTAP
ncbi:MAG: hypothetical protein Q4G26_13875 [Paracoccus sp. (in: a-proteobacteria)]|nr:hypothetical protein [Paracoccus sp. (in: a-proteobacteria)]